MISNTGSDPADDVDFKLYIPDGPLVTEGEGPEEPEAPDPPVPPRTSQDMFLASIARGAALAFRPDTFDLPEGLSRELPNVSGFRVRRSESVEGEAHVRRAKHTSAVPIGSLYFTYRSAPLRRRLHPYYGESP